MSSSKQVKMVNYINWRLKITLVDGRQLVGHMLTFDRHMNIVLADTEEFRRVKRKQNKAATAPGSAAPTQVINDEKRTLGLIIIRGAIIVSVSIEGPPPAEPSARLGTGSGGGATTIAAGPGISRPAAAGRGLPTSLTGPAVGVGGTGAIPFGAGYPGTFPPGFVPTPGGRGGPPAPGGFAGAPGFPNAPPSSIPFPPVPPGFPGGPPAGAPPGGRGFPPGFNQGR